MRTLLMILVIMSFANWSNAQSIEKFSIDSGGASVTAGGIQMLYTIGEVNVQELNAGGILVSEGFINADLKIRIHPKLFLQGPILNPTNAGLMNDNLRASGFIPTTSPYTDGATCNASVFNVTGNNAIVDWVWIELRNKTNNTSVIFSQSALLQRDGDVVDTNGTSYINLNVAADNYYVVVNHKNHLGTMTNTPIPMSRSSDPVVVDFTNITTNTYGSQARAELTSGKMALWAGDANGDGLINFSGDVNRVLVDIVLFPTNTSFSSSYDFVDGYLQSDIFLDGNVSFSNENNQILLSIILFPLNTSFSSQYNFFEEQLPSPSVLRSAAQLNRDFQRLEQTLDILNN
ncbi:hemagglutinin protein [Winogradskyella bathintestinalis]|uniref:Hemagglutinin protein n=1 Tax=Winogradskyella bathintestinalis TaxID=3035208 RepID=A0ABT7ZWR9_9FLAO|nr:hemagglutinin protein [Winogradskyella bathintestinalis]MDN3493458.1 hemagglutinin protein [Winogradskyella bathintestinalis]